MESPKVFMLASQLTNLGCDRCNTRVEWEVSSEGENEDSCIILSGQCECRHYRFKVYMVEMLEVKDGISLGELFK